MMHKKELRKPDGRRMTLYSDRPIPEGIVATAPKGNENAEPANPHLRWHPLRAEWVAYASHRQNRTFLPPKDFSPLAVTRGEEFPTEMPAGDYDVAIFENLFPSFSPRATAQPDSIVPTRPADGACEVVVFTKDPDTSLGRLPADRIRLILQAIGDRSAALGATGKFHYVLPFENRGVEMGVTLHHPHGQMYAYPFIPPVAATMLQEMKTFHAREGRGLFVDLLAKEIADGRRIIHRGEGVTAFIPVCARYPYETWIAPERAVAHLEDLSEAEVGALARALKAVIQKHDGLFSRPAPYLMLMYQAPYDGTEHPEAHLHFQIYPPYRTKDRLKYLAGTELGSGIYVNDSLPEEKAVELRAVGIEGET